MTRPAGADATLRVTAKISPKRPAPGAHPLIGQQHSGTFTSSPGHHWTMVSPQWQDGGTYPLPDPNALVLTGKLGPGGLVTRLPISNAMSYRRSWASGALWFFTDKP